MSALPRAAVARGGAARGRPHRGVGHHVRRYVLGFLAITLAWGCAGAPTISGPARVVDGDSLEIDAVRIRLHAVDAPEARQICGMPGGTWPCGAAATAKLRELVSGRVIHCRQQDVDDYGRSVAVCHNGDVDLGAAMVAAGLARAYRRYGHDYVGEEEAARGAQLGMWVGAHDAPWDWRRTGPVAGPSSTPSTRHAGERGDCRIKGNINRAGERIYHVPGSRSYDDTQIDESQGERWFCSVEEAERAGWRAPRGR